MDHPIVVPLDGSPLAEQALPYAATLAQTCRAPLLLVEAATVTPRPREAAEDARTRACDEAAARLEGLRGDLAARDVRADVVVELAPSADVIRETAQARHAQLIVSTTHGWGGHSPWTLGSVAEQTLRHSRLSTLCLSPQALAAGDANRLHRRLLVPTDGSPISERMFPVAQRLARQLGVPVTLLRVIDPVGFYSGATMLPYGSLLPPNLVEDAVAAEQTALAAEAARWRARGIDAEARVVSSSASEGIAKVAAECGAGWIAMASHGRGGVGGFVLGSTARRILQHVPLPVLIGAGAFRDTISDEAPGACRSRKQQWSHGV
ncbi:MAG: universal stress protein [Chloroflexota bacterium]